MVVIVPVLNMRKGPSHESEVVSQALFAENVTVFQKSEKWSLIKTSDGYSGWVLSDSSMCSFFYQSSFQVNCLACCVYANKDIKIGPILSLPFGVRIEVVDEKDPDWVQVKLPLGAFSYVRKGTIAPFKALSKEELVPFSQKFLNIPYIWGGRSSFGFDCSGFVQMLYSQMGIQLERDSSEQCRDPRLRTINKDELNAGDLIFWGQSAAEIRHVALYIGDQKFIHTSIKEQMPWVRISHLSDLTWNGGAYPYREFKTLG